MSLPTRVFFINLDTREDRRKEFEDEFLPHFTLRRVPGVVTEENGWLGCTHAHVLALKAALKETGDEYLCVMEDDAVLVSGIRGMEDAFEGAKEKGFDVLMLNVLYEEFAPGEEGRIRRLTFGNSTAAYIVRRSYAPTLIEGFTSALYKGRATGDRVKFALDMWMNRLVKRDTWLTAVPNPIHQRDSFSDIDMRFEEKDQTL